MQKWKLVSFTRTFIKVIISLVVRRSKLSYTRHKCGRCQLSSWGRIFRICTFHLSSSFFIPKVFPILVFIISCSNENIKRSEMSLSGN